MLKWQTSSVSKADEASFTGSFSVCTIKNRCYKNPMAYFSFTWLSKIFASGCSSFISSKSFLKLLSELAWFSISQTIF